MATLKLLGIFLVMIVLLIKKMPLSRVVLLGGLGIILLTKNTPQASLKMIEASLFSKAVVDLLIVLALIMLLEEILRTEHYLDKTLTSLEVLVPYPRVILMLLPAFIGLIPSAGGAIFSAPLVEKASKDMKVTPEQKSYVNFFYRHITEYMLPIYPNVLLASAITGLSVTALLTYMIPYGFFNILFGLYFVLKIPKLAKKANSVKKRTMLLPFLSATLPIFLIVILVVILQMEVKWAILIVVVLLLIKHGYTPKKLAHATKDALNYKTLWLVIVIMAFKGVLEGSGILKDLPEMIAGLPLPNYVVFGLILFSLGLITGLQTAAVGLGYPIVMASLGSISPFLGGMLYACGLSGQMLTPLHLCLTLTVDYFHASLTKVMQMLLLPELTLLSFAMLTYGLLH